MTAKDVIEIVKESNLWATLAPQEQQEAIVHALRITQLSTIEENTKNTVGEVYSGLEA